MKPTTSTVILGASKPEQIIDNLKALEVIPKLTPAILERIEGILDNKPDSAVCLSMIPTRFRCADLFFIETLGSLPAPRPFPETVSRVNVISSNIQMYQVSRNEVIIL